MDKTDTYLRMSNHPKIQSQQPKVGKRQDFFCISFFEGGRIWLPRQDDIQKMMCDDTDYEKFALGIDDEETIFELLFSRLWTVYTSGVFAGIKMYSGEQLWLAFYMHEKHDLIWDGGEWKIGDEK